MRWFCKYCVILILGSAFLSTCHNSPLQNEPRVFDVPSHELSAYKIMKDQGVGAIHYVQYDSIIVNGQPDSTFHAEFEYYIDTCHVKAIQYYLTNHAWNTTVYNLCEDSGWNVYDHTLTAVDFRVISMNFTQTVQRQLGSWLTGTIQYRGQESVDGKLCDLYQDATGTLEWIWPEYKLPLMRRTEYFHDVHQVNVRKKKILSINQPISPEIYIPSN